VTMDFKKISSRVCLVSTRDTTNLSNLAQTHRLLAKFIATGAVSACHDVSDGGIVVAAAEMCIGSGLGLDCNAALFSSDECLAERPGQSLIELSDNSKLADLQTLMKEIADVTELGQTQQTPKLSIRAQNQATVDVGIDAMTAVWRGTLDW
jgi:phosphoribosylformylglycinamidine (FGAM) synthase-like enzyme